MRFPLLVLSVALALGGAGTAFADDYDDPGSPEYRPGYTDSRYHDHDDEDFDRRGGYVGLGGVGAFNEMDFDDEVKYSLGLDTRGGYRFHEHLAVEGQLMYLHNNGDDFDAGKFNWETLSGTANLKIFVLTGRVQPYLLGGIGGSWAHTETKVAGVRNDSSNAVFTFRGGAGLDFYVDDDWLIYTEASYLGFTGQFDADGMIPLVLGAQYRF